MRGNAISGAPIIRGTCQLANPVNMGIAKPNTIIKPCMVVMELKKSGLTKRAPSINNSARITKAIIPPTKNIMPAVIRYMVPMSLWLVANTQRLIKALNPFGRASECVMTASLIFLSYLLIFKLIIYLIW